MRPSALRRVLVAGLIAAGVGFVASAAAIVWRAPERDPEKIGGFDALVFSRLARNLAAGNGYSASPSAPYVPYAYRTPAYPLFLAGIYAVAGERHGFQAAVLVQALLHFASCLGAGWLARRLTASPEAGILGAIGALGALPKAFANLNVEALAMPLVVAVAVLWTWSLGKTSWRVHAAGGVLMSLLVYTRPEFVFLPVAAGAACLFKRQGRLLAAFAGGCVLVALPWAGWTASSLGRPMLLSRGAGVALWAGTWSVRGEIGDEMQDEQGRPFFRLYPDRVFHSVEERRMLELYRAEFFGQPLPPGLREHPEDALRRLALERIAENPGAWLWHRAQSAVWLFYQEWLPPQRFSPVSALWLNAGISGVLLFLAAAGAVHGWRRPETWIPLVPIAGKILVHVPFHAAWRYFFPVYPLIMALAVLGLGALRPRLFPGGHDGPEE